MENKLVTIAKFADSAQASLAKQLLADFGIESVLAGENATNLYGLPAIAQTNLQTLQTDAAQATQILESNMDGGSSAQPNDTEEC
jgi:hypothetical protein